MIDGEEKIKVHRYYLMNYHPSGNSSNCLNKKVDLAKIIIIIFFTSFYLENKYVYQ